EQEDCAREAERPCALPRRPQAWRELSRARQACGLRGSAHGRSASRAQSSCSDTSHKKYYVNLIFDVARLGRDASTRYHLLAEPRLTRTQLVSGDWKTVAPGRDNRPIHRMGSAALVAIPPAPSAAHEDSALPESS